LKGLVEARLLERFLSEVWLFVGEREEEGREKEV
jgi:hypothetical protein